MFSEGVLPPEIEHRKKLAEMLLANLESTVSRSRVRFSAGETTLRFVRTTVFFAVSMTA
jgi:hypothetical protein